MSVPISMCALSAAARQTGFGRASAQEVFERLAEALAYDLRCGHFTTLPCRCQPPCPIPTEEQFQELEKRLEAYQPSDPS